MKYLKIAQCKLQGIMNYHALPEVCHVLVMINTVSRNLIIASSYGDRAERSPLTKLFCA